MGAKRSARLPGVVWLIVVAGTLLSLFAGHQVYRNAQAQALEQFGFAADQVTLRIEERLATHALVLRGAAGLLDASGEVSRREWRRYVDKLQVSDAVATIQEIGYALYLQPQSVDDFENRIRAEEFPDFRLHPAGERDEYTSILYLEPFDEFNLPAFGYDMFSEPVRRAAMEQARDTGRAALTSKVMLIQETGDDIQPGSLMYVPVYRQGAAIDSLAQRREALVGWTYSAYRMYDLMEGILGDWAQQDGKTMGLRIYDGDKATPERLLFANEPAQVSPKPSAFLQQRLEVFNGTRWLLVFDHLALGQAVATWTTWLTLIGGLIMTALLGSLVYSLSTTRARAMRMAEALTRTVRDREKELETLLTRLQTIADRVPGVVYEYRLMPDGSSAFPYASDGIKQLYGIDKASLEEDASPIFSVVHPDDREGVDSSIRRSAETLTPWRHEYRVIHQDGTEHWLFGDSLPHREPDGSTAWYGVISDITMLKEHEQQLEHLAHFDALTGLPNRTLLVDRLQQAMAQETRQEHYLAVVYLDLDGFKHINDSHGHDAGDQLLITLSQRMKEVMREGDTLSRLGGDEFVAVLLHLADESVAKGFFKRLLEVAALPVHYEGYEISVTASLGVTFYPQAEPIQADQLLRQADQAMYQAKLSGKSRYHLFDAELDRSMRSHHETLERIQYALEQGEFVIHYQPKVNMRTGQVIGVEALVRWQHPERGLLPPAQFLAVIEEHPLSEALGEWVINTALDQAAAWKAAGLELPVSVNVSARQLRQRELVSRLKRLLEDHPELAPGTLELEVLETSTLGDLALVSNLLEECRNIGIQVSLDDFGTGYSSLTYLKQLPAGIVKIDQSFVRDILDDPEDLKILDGVLRLAAAFDREVIAEGVETVQHGDMLLRVGCELAQGYGIARPMPPEAIPDWILHWQPPAHWSGMPIIDHDSMPLLYAGVEHHDWVRRLVSALTSESLERPPLDSSGCNFSFWLDQLRDTWGSELKPLDQQHQQIHRLAESLCTLQDSGEEQQAIDRLPELYAQRDAMLGEIERLLDRARPYVPMNPVQ